MPHSLHYLDDPERQSARASLSDPRLEYLQPGTQEDQESGKLLDYFRVFQRRRYTVALICLLGIIAALLVSLPQQKMYRSRASLEIADKNEDLLTRGIDAQPRQSDEAETYFQTQIRLLQSETLLERVIRKLNLHDNAPPGPVQTFIREQRARFGFPAPPPDPESARLLQSVMKHLTIRESGQTRIVEILYESPDPQMAAGFANTLVEEFIKQTQELHWQSTSRTGEWLTSQLADMKVKLEQSEAQLNSMAGASGLASSDGKDSIEEMKLRRLEDDLTEVRAQRADAQAKMEMATSAAAETVPDILNDATLKDYRIKLSDLQRQEAELKTTLTPAHYRVQEVEQQIQELQSAIAKQRVNILTRIRNDYDTIRRREDLLVRESLDQGKIVDAQSARAVNYNMLKHEVDTSQHLYELLLQRVKESAVDAAIQASNIIPVDPAKPPLRPYKPDMLMNSAIGFMGGFFLSVGIVLVMELSARGVLAPGEARLHLNVPELGVIPQTKLRASRMLGSGRRRTVISDPARLRGDDEPLLELITWREKPSRIAESFRAVLPSLFFGTQAGDRPRIVVMTSAKPGEGKTTVSSNLAICVAEVTSNVLLLDGDMRRPRLHRIFGMSRQDGLGELLSSHTPLDWAMVQKSIRPTQVSGLSLLPSGAMTDSAANLLYSRRLPELLAILRKQFDMVIIDAPPVLQVPDARLFGRLVDGVVMVIRAAHTHRQAALQASQLLNDDRTRILGTIVNSSDPKAVYTYGYAS